MPARFFSRLQNCSEADGELQAEYLLTDRGYDTAAITLKAVEENMIPAILPLYSYRKERMSDASFSSILIRRLAIFLDCSSAASY